MIASQRAESTAPGRARALAGCVALLVGAAACTTPTPTQQALPRLLEPLGRSAPRVPQAVDRDAASLAAAALIGDEIKVGAALDRVEHALLREAAEQKAAAVAARALSRDVDVLEAEPRRRALLPLAIDLANTATGDERAYREAARQLLKRGDLNPAHRARLEQAVSDDPLLLARKRMFESYESVWARAFNAVSVPLGRSLVTGFTTAPYEIALGVAHYLAGTVERPTISLQERQALAHWERFLARNPDADEAEAVLARVEASRERLSREHRNHFVRNASLALEHGQPRLAASQAERALSHQSDDAKALRLRDEAQDAIAENRRLRLASVAWDPAAAADSSVGTSRHEEFARALLLAGTDGDLARRLGDALDSSSEDDSLRDELEFALAGAQIERGFETAGWERLDRIARRDPEDSNMARHAAALLANPSQHPHRAFLLRKTRGRERAVASGVLGPWASGPRYSALPAEVAYLIDAPAIAQAALSAPFRLLFSPLQPGATTDFRRGAALAAYDYLERRPHGEHARDLVRWLFSYEEERNNASAALRLADLIPDFDPRRRLELAELAAEQQLRYAAQHGRRDLRSMLLRDVVREFPDSQAGTAAGLRARREANEATPQRIRLTRGFLLENPQIVSARGLSLEPMLLDGDLRNGELHPLGITFLGGRWIEFALMPASGDEDAEPLTRQQEISAERLARAATLLDEAVALGVHLDTDDDQGTDASRDLFLEQARLGLAEEIDARPAAQSTYVYRGLRERYGVVRGRESILPFDLVLQGSFSDLRLGAFPRWRQPKQTPDAFLYR